MTTETANEIGPWTVKGVRPEDRAEIQAAAKRAGLGIGAYIKAASEAAIARERTSIFERPDQSSQAVGPAHVDSLAVVVQLAAVLPGITGAEKCGALAARMRRAIDWHLGQISPPAPRAGSAAPRIAGRSSRPLPPSSAAGTSPGCSPAAPPDPAPS